jgi:phosphate/phosphite/phosphonate ABC transporter binding protein
VSEAHHRALLDALSVYLSTQVGVPVAAYRALTYEDLATRISTGDLQVAWLPPALFVELERSVGMRAVAAAERGLGVGYFSVFFTLVDSDIRTVEDIPGHSVGWVDPGSASGYVFPRLQLASYGIDPTTAFPEEVFFRSHQAVVRGVVDRAVDVGATYVHLDPSEPSKVVRAGWQPPPAGVDPSSIQWLDPFGPLPADVVAVSNKLDQVLAEKIGRAFFGIHQVEAVRLAAQRQFGTGRFVPVHERSYEILRRAMESAEGRGVEVSASLRPSLVT